MIDFVKISIEGIDKSKLFENQLLSFEREINEFTGEINLSKPNLSKYKNLVFKVFDTGYIEMSGSLHRYYNKGCHNYDDFTHSNFLKVLEDFKNKFGIDPKQCIMRNLEIGLNIELPFSPNLILNNLLLHKGKEFINPYHFDYYQSKHQRYYLKVYNKSKQYKLSTNILRFEIKYIKMKDLNNNGINSLSDIKKLENWKLFKENIITQWENTLFFDTSIKSNNLIKPHIENLLNYKNPNFWKNLDRKKRYYHSQKLKSITLKYSNNRSDLIRNLLNQKWDVLTVHI